MTDEDTRSMLRNRTFKVIDPEQPEFKIIFAPTNAICDVCGETIWAHGIYPERARSFEY